MKNELPLQYGRLGAAAMAQPSAREVRAVIARDVRSTSYRKAFAKIGGCVAPYTVALAIATLPGSEAWPIRLLGSYLLGAMGARAFDVAHEAMHCHFTGNRQLDRWIARIFLLTTLAPLGPLIYTHIHRHHRYTNIKGYDTQWSPLSLDEYRALSPARKLLERIYRSPAGLGLYWGLGGILPCFTARGLYLSEKVQPRPIDGAAFRRDRAFVYAYITASVAGWYTLAPWLGISGPAAVLSGFVVPLLYTQWLLGTTTYLEHTSENIGWFASPEHASFFRAQFAGTTSLLLQHRRLTAMFSLDRPHVAHHVDMSIPAYGLAAATDMLHAAFPGVSLKVVVSMRQILTTAARCKLYDFATHQWLDFSGRPTTEPHFQPQAAVPVAATS
jgi:omega-6 fatty acid desaturase (delta-12 desaturase)